MNAPARFWFRTASGIDIDLERPDPALIRIEDIAVSLSRQARFNGNTKSEPYSVAEHSVRVSIMVEEETKDREMALRGLMHDAAEWAIGDLVAPLKAYLRQHTYALDVLETKIERAIFTRFGLQHIRSENPMGMDEHERIQAIIKRADLIALAGEWRDHVSKGPTEVTWPFAARERPLPAPLSAIAAERAFLDRFEALTGAAQ